MRPDRVCRAAVLTVRRMRALARDHGLPRSADEQLAVLERDTIAAASYVQGAVAGILAEELERIQPGLFESATERIVAR